MPDCLENIGHLLFLVKQGAEYRPISWFTIWRHVFPSKRSERIETCSLLFRKCVSPNRTPVYWAVLSPWFTRNKSCPIFYKQSGTRLCYFPSRFDTRSYTGRGISVRRTHPGASEFERQLRFIRRRGLHRRFACIYIYIFEQACSHIDQKPGTLIFKVFSLGKSGNSLDRAPF